MPGSFVQSPLAGSLLAGNPPPPEDLSAPLHIPGQVRGQPYILPLNEKVLSTHVIAFGQTGCGKTNVLRELLRQQRAHLAPCDVIVCFDPKGDFLAACAQPGDMVLSCEPVHGQVSWNIFAEIMHSRDAVSLRERCDNIARLLFRDAIKNSSQSFFPLSACDLFASILFQYGLNAGKDAAFAKVYLNNAALVAFIDRSDVPQLKKLLTHPMAAGAISLLGNENSDQAAGILAELKMTVRRLFTGAFGQQRGSWGISSFVHSGKGTLFLEYDIVRGATQKPVYGLLLDLALQESLANSNRVAGRRVFFWIDELALLPQLEQLEPALTFGRSQGTRIMAATQSLGQLSAHYNSEQDALNIASGFCSCLCGAVTEPLTRRFVTDRCGESLILQRTAVNGAFREDILPRKAICDWDFQALGLGDLIVSLPYTPPFHFHANRFR